MARTKSEFLANMSHEIRHAIAQEAMALYPFSAARPSQLPVNVLRRRGLGPSRAQKDHHIWNQSYLWNILKTKYCLKALQANRGAPNPRPPESS